ncbi:MAG: cache domain-containing protein [Candidatus Margulisiibacteriota bacterium]|jgi:hypothetical protein
MKVKLIGLALLCFTTAAFAMGIAPDLPPVNVLGQQIAGELTQMDGDLAKTAELLGSTGLSGEAAAALLQQLYNNHKSVVDVVTTNPDGYILLVEPATYKSSELSYIGNQPHFVRLKKSGLPVMSSMFKTVEGFYAVSLAYPVRGTSNQALGYVSIVFKPDALMRNVVKNYQFDFFAVDTMALQLDGRIIYDKDPLQVGLMTFESSLYRSVPSLLALAQKVTMEATGSGSYDFPEHAGGAPVKKTAEWTTIALHGMEWRLVIAKN